MKAIIIRSTFFTAIFNIAGIALCPFIIIKKNSRNEKKLINHEKIHIAQQLELWIIPFYILYIFEYFKKRI